MANRGNLGYFQKRKPKARNWVAVSAHFRRQHTSENRRALEQKSACRKKVLPDG